MKQLKFFAMAGFCASLLLLTSCNNSGEKSGSEVDSSAAKKDSTPPPPPPASSGPSMVMTITHKVADYAKWKPNYDAHDSIRLASGLHSYVIARGVEDSNMVMVALKIDDLDKAKAFASSPELKERMKKGGVAGPTSIDYLESVMNDTTAIQQTVRVMVKHKVKDWDAWKKSFDSHKQTRVDAGLIDRVVAHTIGDDKSVMVVCAVTDMAKAKAFMNSKDLKDKMAEAGVDGPPSIFFYRIVAKY